MGHALANQDIVRQVLKTGDASALSVVSGIKALLPQLEKTLPGGVTVTPLNDHATRQPAALPRPHAARRTRRRFAQTPRRARRAKGRR